MTIKRIKKQEDDLGVSSGGQYPPGTSHPWVLTVGKGWTRRMTSTRESREIVGKTVKEGQREVFIRFTNGKGHVGLSLVIRRNI